MICSIHALLQLRGAYLSDKAPYYKISSGHKFLATKHDLIRSYDELYWTECPAKYLKSSFMGIRSLASCSSSAKLTSHGLPANRCPCTRA